MVNRAPVLTLWAAVVAEFLGGQRAAAKDASRRSGHGGSIEPGRAGEAYGRGAASAQRGPAHSIGSRPVVGDGGSGVASGGIILIQPNQNAIKSLTKMIYFSDLGRGQKQI